MNGSRSHHFIGIGGVGMSAIAQILHERGQAVSGSDSQESATVNRLRALGIPVFVGHEAAHVAGAASLVVSTAVRPDNPEWLAARDRGIPVRHRADCLADLMQAQESIAVCGTHGKTTTTGLVASILLGAEADPTVLVGGHLPALGGTARQGQGRWLVAEADESDKSLAKLTADLAILLNVEGDHLEHYRDEAEIHEVFATFLDGLKPGGRIVACLDGPGIRSLTAARRERTVWVGTGEEADHRITDLVLEPTSSLFRLDGYRYQLAVGGRHNILNAACAIVACELAGIPRARIQAGLSAFTGVGRRFDVRGTERDVTVVDDYAHHPTEIRATLETARLRGRPLWVVFQPHRYTRLEALFEGFAGAFEDIVGLGVMRVYGAGEPPGRREGSDLSRAIRARDGGFEVHDWPDGQDVLAGLVPRLRAGDLVLLLGAGNITHLAAPLLEALRAPVGEPR